MHSSTKSVQVLIWTLLIVLIVASRAFAASTSNIAIDGSSTVFPISEAVAEEFQSKNKNTRVAVAVSGTGGGFKKFCAKELDITGASRPIEAVELELCKKNGVKFVELPIAYDGIAVVVNKSNTFVDQLTVAELKKVWSPVEKVGDKHPVKTWKDIRATWPAEPIKLYGPGHDSGTFDYFTKAINGKEKASRDDFTASEDDNSLVVGVSGDKNSLGYFGYAYYVENKGKLKLVSVDAGKGAIAPNHQTIVSGVYAPLSRPLFVYVSVDSLKKPEVQKFADFYVANAGTLSEQVGYVTLGTQIYQAVTKRLAAKTEGSAFASGKGLSLSQALQ